VTAIPKYFIGVFSAEMNESAPYQFSPFLRSHRLNHHSCTRGLESRDRFFNFRPLPGTGMKWLEAELLKLGNHNIAFVLITYGTKLPVSLIRLIPSDNFLQLPPSVLWSSDISPRWVVSPSQEFGEGQMRRLNPICSYLTMHGSKLHQEKPSLQSTECW
jgi:hypothetical protein